LKAVYRETSAWPVKRDFGTLIRWFDWQFYSGLFDVCPKAAIYDEDY